MNDKPKILFVRGEETYDELVGAAVRPTLTKLCNESDSSDFAKSNELYKEAYENDCDIYVHMTCYKKGVELLKARDCIDALGVCRFELRDRNV